MGPAWLLIETLQGHAPAVPSAREIQGQPPRPPHINLMVGKEISTTILKSRLNPFPAKPMNFVFINRAAVLLSIILCTGCIHTVYS